MSADPLLAVPYDPKVPGPDVPADVDWEQLARRIAELSTREGEIATILEAIRGILRADPRSETGIGPRDIATLTPAGPHPVEAIRSPHPQTAAREDAADLSPYLGLTLAELERRAIVAALISNDGNKAKTARALGISLRSIYNKMRRYGMVVSKKLREQDPAWEGHHTS